MFAVNQFGDNTGQDSKFYILDISQLPYTETPGCGIGHPGSKNPKRERSESRMLLPPVDATAKWGPHTSHLLLKLLCSCNNYPSHMDKSNTKYP